MRLAIAVAQRRDLGQQGADVDRLDQVVIRTLTHAPDLVGFEALAGAHDDRNVTRRFVAGDGPRRLVAVHARHHHVHQDQVGQFAPRRVDRLLAAGGGDDVVAGLPQGLGEHVAFGR
jgi:hypothetical protein